MISVNAYGWNIVIIKEINVLLLLTTRFLFKKNALHIKAYSDEQFCVSTVSYEKHLDKFVKI